MKRENLIDEARRYVENARKILNENGRYDAESNRYEDDKYVRAAGNYLWLSVLLALDAVFDVRADQRTRVDVNDYKAAVAKRDKNLLGDVNNGYCSLHLSMNYDGNTDKGICNSGFRLANTIINKCAMMIN